MSSTTHTAPAPSVRVSVDIEVRDLPAQEYLGKRFTSFVGSVGPDVQAALAGLYGRIQDAGAAPAGHPFLIASQPTLKGKMDIEVGAPCAPVPEPAAGQHRGRLEAGKAAVATHRGPYDQIGPVYGALFEWASANGHRPAGPPREVYLNEAQNPADYLTEVILPIA